MDLTEKTVVVTGGVGSLGRVLVRRLLAGELGRPRQIVVFSRDEAKQHAMRLAHERERAATDDVIYRTARGVLRFEIGDVRDRRALARALRDAEVVFHAAALKQVPSCEYFPDEAVATNVGGAENLVGTIRDLGLGVELVVGISTDKACKPVNVMGMTKAIQERILVAANLRACGTRFVCVRYGNVLASRGSVLPLFHEQIRRGDPVTITTPEMTRFLMSLDESVDAIFAAVRRAAPGETFVPRVPSARVVDLADALIGVRPIEKVFTGIRPGEKTHEVLVSEEEIHRTRWRDGYYVIAPLLPELRRAEVGDVVDREVTSADHTLAPPEVAALLARNGVRVEDAPDFSENGEG